jgi:hypothetical protein
MQPRSEGLVEQRLLRYLKTIPGLTQFKMGRDGWPDRILCYRGLFIGIEIKSERTNHKPTVRQKQRLRQLHDSHALVGVVRSNDEVQALIAQIDDWHSRTGGLPW